MIYENVMCLKCRAREVREAKTPHGGHITRYEDLKCKSCGKLTKHHIREIVNGSSEEEELFKEGTAIRACPFCGQTPEVKEQYVRYVHASPERWEWVDGLKKCVYPGYTIDIARPHVFIQCECGISTKGLIWAEYYMLPKSLIGKEREEMYRKLRQHKVNKLIVFWNKRSDEEAGQWKTKKMQ